MSGDRPVEMLVAAARAVCGATPEIGADFAALRVALEHNGRRPEEWPNLIEAARGITDPAEFARSVEAWLFAQGDAWPAALSILHHPDPRLYQPSTPIEPAEFGPTLRDFLDRMVQLMLVPREDGRPQGAGLAAPQVGVNRRCVVMACAQGAYVHGARVLVMVNPQITLVKGVPVKDVEGCLSVPGEDVPVSRAPQVLVRYQRPDTGVVEHVVLEGFEARCVQHEIDHLDGITLVGRMRPGQRFAYERRHAKVVLDVR